MKKMRRIIWLVMTGLIITGMHVAPVSAAISSDITAPVKIPRPSLNTESNRYRTRNNNVFFDPNDTGAALCVATPGDATSLQGENNTEKAFGFFLAKGLTAEQTAGIIGNLIVESGMIPDNQENSQSFPGGGWGLAQWTGSRRTDLQKALEKAGKGDLYTNEKTPSERVEELLLFELNFLWDEATKRGDIKSLKADTAVLAGGTEHASTSSDLIKAAIISWERHFEIARNPALGARYDRGQEAFDKYGKGGAATPGATTPTTPAAPTTPDTPASPDIITTTPTSPDAGCAQQPGGEVTDGSFVYYSQYDPAWAKTPYGSPGKTILTSGCGPTSMAMIVSTLTKKKVTPADIVAKYGNKYYDPRYGTLHSLFGVVAKDNGLISKSIGKNESAAKEVLSRGGLIVAGGLGALPYTKHGHVIVVRATINGKYQVGNPLPSPADQGKASAVAFKNTKWFNTEYSWAAIANPASGIYSVEDPKKQL